MARKSTPESAMRQCRQFLETTLPQMQFLNAKWLMALKPGKLQRKLLLKHRGGSPDIADCWLRSALRVETHYVKRFQKASPSQLRDRLEDDHAQGKWSAEELERLDAQAGNGFTAQDLRDCGIAPQSAQHLIHRAAGAEGPEESGPGAAGAGSGPEDASAPEACNEEADFWCPENDTTGKDNMEKQSTGDEQSVE